MLRFKMFTSVALAWPVIPVVLLACAVRSVCGVKLSQGFGTNLSHQPAGTTRSPSYQASDPTLYCFALARPNSYEVDLVRYQYRKKTSIFGCDGYAVVSNASFKFADAEPVPHSMLVTPGNLDVEMKGVFWTALNTPVFLRVWKLIFHDAQFLNYHWTAKVDPDAVFLPLRLRHLLMMHRLPPSKGVYFSNCDIDESNGFHGPLEVMSRAATGVLKRGMDDCLQANVANVSYYSEDVFFGHCLQYLHVRRQDMPGLLLETTCCRGCITGMGCGSGKVAYHPFKTEDLYDRCLQAATYTKENLTGEAEEGDDQTATRDRKVEQDPEVDDEKDDEEGGGDKLWNHLLGLIDED